MSRAGSVVAAIALGSVVAVSAPAQASVPADGSDGESGKWTSSVVTTGAGMLENLEFDGSGSMVLSQSALIGPGALLKVARTEHGQLWSVMSPDLAGWSRVTVPCTSPRATRLSRVCSESPTAAFVRSTSQTDR